MNRDLVLVDTSIWVSALGGKGQSEIKSKLDTLLRENRLATNQMVRLELLAGARTFEEFSRLKSRLDALPQLEIGASEWDQAAQLVFELRRKGKTLPHTDIIIAVTAIRNGASLLHADEHFELMAKDSGLITEDLTAFLHP